MERESDDDSYSDSFKSISDSEESGSFLDDDE